MFKLLVLALLIICSWQSAALGASEDMLSALNNGTNILTNWRLDGGDPCRESWIGITCSGSEITYMNLSGLHLSGPLVLHGLRHLIYLDLSSNLFTGTIPYELSHSLTYLNLAGNSLVGNIPASVFFLENLQYLNLSGNSLSGPLDDSFSGLGNLIDLDLSRNNFIGNLPISFKSLRNLLRLFLQDNQFVGSISVLSDLPLIELNILNNMFEYNATLSNTTTASTPNPTTPSTPNTTTPTKRSSRVNATIVVSLVVGALVLVALLLATTLSGQQGGWSKLKRLSSVREMAMRNLEKTEP